ncbi:hypothetical protein LCGC14_1831740, partial [marine sediment metagenome]
MWSTENSYTLGGALTLDASTLGAETISGPDHFFQGQVAGVLMFNRALGPDECLGIAKGKTFSYLDSLVSWWDMSTINPPDIGFRNLGNDGVGTGLVAATDIVNGIGGGLGMEFDAAGEYVTVPHDSSLNVGGGGFSMSVWVKVNTLGVHKGVFSKLTGDDGYTLYFWTDDTLYWRVDAANARSHTFGGAGVSIGRWYHVVVTHDGANTSELYVDGVLATGGTGVGTVTAVTDDLILGMRTAAGLDGV